jgi:cytochrome c oxidase subunit IV
MSEPHAPAAHGTSAPHDAGAHDEHHPHVNYWAVFGALCALTVASVIADSIGGLVQGDVRDAVLHAPEV